MTIHLARRFRAALVRRTSVLEGAPAEAAEATPAGGSSSVAGRSVTSVGVATISTTGDGTSDRPSDRTVPEMAQRIAVMRVKRSEYLRALEGLAAVDTPVTHASLVGKHEARACRAGPTLTACCWISPLVVAHLSPHPNSGWLRCRTASQASGRR